ncbi:hypothetical protein F5879DRAFT_1062557 [Lentinula edodes]|nr:hypothetical protein F5879DRAFT_1062557 [Lentinula edodes]
MKKGDNCLTAFPTQLVRLAAEKTDGSGATASRKKAWEKVGLMGKMLQEMSWKDRTNELKEDIVEHITQKIDNKVLTFKTWVTTAKNETAEAARMVEKVTEYIKEVVGRLDFNMSNGETAVEGKEGEITGSPTGTVNLSYAQALQVRNVVNHLQRPKHATAIQASKQMDRRIVVKTGSTLDLALGEAELVAKTNLAVGQVDGMGEDKVKVIAVSKTQEKGIVCLLRTPEEAQWLEERTRLESFCKAWGAEVMARLNYHEVVVEFIPVSLDLEDEWMQRMIESTNNLQQGSIAMARWIKKLELCRSGQQVAHAIFTTQSRSEVNRIIGEGILIAGKYLEVHKNLSDPVR